MNKKISLILVAFVFCVSGIAYAKDGAVPGKPFEFLQQQVDALKTQIETIQQTGFAGYWRTPEGGGFSAGLFPGYVYGTSSTCPLGMSPVGGGGEAKAFIDEETRYDIFLMTSSKPFEYTCESPGDGGPPNTYYGWEVSWLNTYSPGTGDPAYVQSFLSAYVICVGEEETDPGCN